MNLTDLSNLLGGLVGLILTLMIFSYLLGDNLMFRLAIYIFIGATTGYVAVIALYTVILPRLFWPLLFGSMPEKTMALVALAVSLMLFSKASARLSSMGSLVVAFLVGIGAAAAVGGALLGTLFPQIQATMNSFDIQAIRQSGKSIGWELFNGLIILVGTISTLIYFHFGARSKSGMEVTQPIWLKVISRLGQAFIAIAFGALFTGVYAAALAALIERMSFIINFILSFIAPAS